MRHVIPILALVLTACSAPPRYAEDVHLPNTPGNPKESISDATRRFEDAIGHDVSHNILARWSIEYIGHGFSATYWPARVIRIAKENKPDLVLKHEVTHALLFEAGIPGFAHHPIMCRHELCYGSVGCSSICE